MRFHRLLPRVTTHAPIPSAFSENMSVCPHFLMARPLRTQDRRSTALVEGKFRKEMPAPITLLMPWITKSWKGPKPNVVEDETRSVNRGTHSRGEAGLSLIEVAIVVAILLIVIAIAIPQAIRARRALRAISDARGIASQLALAKMRAANGFTRTRLNCREDTRSCQIEVCTSKGASACNTFTAEGGPFLLSDEMSFGFGGISTPAGSQTTIQNSNLIIFNSRSFPIDNSGAPTGTYAVYIRNEAGDTYAVSVFASGRIAVWRYNNGAWIAQ